MKRKQQQSLSFFHLYQLKIRRYPLLKLILLTDKTPPAMMCKSRFLQNWAALPQTFLHVPDSRAASVPQLVARLCTQKQSFSSHSPVAMSRGCYSDPAKASGNPGKKSELCVMQLRCKTFFWMPTQM